MLNKSIDFSKPHAFIYSLKAKIMMTIDKHLTWFLMVFITITGISILLIAQASEMSLNIFQIQSLQMHIKRLRGRVLFDEKRHKSVKSYIDCTGTCLTLMP